MNLKDLQDEKKFNEIRTEELNKKIEENQKRMTEIEKLILDEINKLEKRKEKSERDYREFRYKEIFEISFLSSEWTSLERETLDLHYELNYYYEEISYFEEAIEEVKKGNQHVIS